MVGKTVSQLIAGFCCLILLTACVTDEQFRYLNDQLVTLNKRVDGLEQETEKKLSGKLNAELGTVRERQASNVAQLNELRSEISRLSGQVEENNHWIKRSVERDTAERDGLEKRISALEGRSAELEAKIDRLYTRLGLKPPAVKEIEAEGTKAVSPPEKEPAPVKPVEKAPDVSPEQRLYDVNLALFKNKEYESAISGFKNFLDKYPKSAFADNAHFWIGECYMKLGQYEQAILAYQQVIKKYPKGNKVANALLRQAKAFDEINDRISSKLLLKKLIRKYPKSKEAAVAKKRLARMK